MTQDRTALQIDIGQILVPIYQEVTTKKDQRFLKHVSTYHHSADIAEISILEKPTRGPCVLRVARVNKLKFLQKLDEDAVEFMKAWLAIVTCHAFLWSNGIEYGDPSLYNAIYDEERKCGVLIDFDHVIRQRGPGPDRTGTVPLMALNLLTEKYFNGHITPRYHHELEAFIWMLPFVALGGARSGPTTAKAWITFDFNTCRREKNDFCSSCRPVSSSRSLIPSFKDWGKFLDNMMFGLHAHRSSVNQIEDDALQMPMYFPSPPDDFLARQCGDDLWNKVSASLRLILNARPELKRHVYCLLKHQPMSLEEGDYEILTNVEANGVLI